MHNQWPEQGALRTLNFSIPALLTHYVPSVEIEHLTEIIPCFNSFPNKPFFFYVSAVQAFEDTVGKGEIARNGQFLLFPVFLILFENLPTILIKCEIVLFKLYQFGRV